MNVHPEKLPPGLAAVQGLGDPKVAEPLIENVIESPGAKPVPLAATVVPTVPDAGLRVNVGSGATESVSAAQVISSNDAVAVNVPGVEVE